ncbi:MAG: hypothetical protein HY901_22440 [Deltaproteobacteria bacterium]|nr:hypothetical protein [Deltaproteobacteria bacterium]
MRAKRWPGGRVVGLSVVVLLSLGVQVGRRSEHPGVSRTRAFFPRAAARLFAGSLPPDEDGRHLLSGFELPARAEQGFAFGEPGRALSVTVFEAGIYGEALREGGAVAYSREDGGASFFTRAPGGWLEEHLLVDGAHPERVWWQVQGARLRQYGASVELLDAAGVARFVVSAPEAQAQDGSIVPVRLLARADRIELVAPRTDGWLLVDPVWAPAGAMAVGRLSHTTTRLANGEVLVTGGNDLANGRHASAEIYNPALNSWRAAAPMSVARMLHAAVLLPDGHVLVAGGLGATDAALDTLETYDPTSDRWSATGRLSVARWGLRAVSLASGRVLLVGGATTQPANAESTVAEEFDPSTGAVAAVGSMAKGRTDFSATALADGRVLVAGGAAVTASSRLASAELYDPSSKQFSSAGDLHFAVQNHAASRLGDGRVLVAGGVTSDGVTARADLFDPATGQWTEPPSMPTASTQLALVTLPDGRALGLGGSNGPAVKAVALFDGLTSQWTVSEELLEARAAPGAAVLLDGDVLATAGGPASAERWDLGLLSPGQPCAAASQCGTGHCVKGTCCDSACDEGCRACTVASGASVDGLCSPTTGTSCDDGRSCTTGDRCLAGACTPTAVACSCQRDEDCPALACRTSPRCDPVLGTCSYQLAPDDSGCDDGDSCTHTDRCSSGTCQGSSYSCTPDSCSAQAACDGTGGCVRVPKQDGTRCGATACTLDECQGGACVPRGLLDCSTAPGVCLLAGTCDPASGQCQSPGAAPDGTPCPGGICRGGACAVAAADGGAPPPAKDAGSAEGPRPAAGCACPTTSPPSCGGEGSPCTTKADCCGAAICATQRTCIPSYFGGACSCSGSASGACISLSASGVTECGVESAAFNECCPDTIWVNGRCKPPGACESE